MVRPQLRYRVRSPQRSRRCLVSLVACFSTGSIHGLLHGVDRQQTESDRQGMLRPRRRQDP